MTMSEAKDLDLSRLKIDRGSGNGDSHSPRHRSGLILYIAGGAFLALSFYFFFNSALKSDPIVEVTTVNLISRGQATSVLTASGYVVAQRKASIASKATGRLVSLEFREGDRVRKGQIIGRLESADVEAALAQAKADLGVAQADKVDAERSLERAQALLNRQLASKADYDAAKARYDRVVASIASRTAAVKAAEVQVENTRIRAPFDGTILTKNADVGEVVAPYAAGASSRVAVVTIADMGSLEVEADVSESNIERVHVDQPCEVTLDAYPGKRYRAVVAKIVPTADRAKATVLTKVRFVERDERILPEMSAKVQFLGKQTSDSTDETPVLVLDPDALTQREGKMFAFVVRDAIATGVHVETGATLGRLVEIRSGLAPGEKVVLKPPADLHTGTRVKVKS